MSTKEIVNQFKPGIVRVVRSDGVGTGFFVGNNGHVATNFHVIHGAKELTVVLSDDTKLAVTRIVDRGPTHDLAIIAVAKEAALRCIWETVTRFPRAIV